jgi:hypothetical protein
MDTSQIDRLSRLAELHAAGTLTDDEFAAEKAKVLRGSRRVPLYAALAAAVLAGAAGVGLWTMQGVEPVASPAAPSARPFPLPSAVPSPTSPARSPQQRLADAFMAATGHRAAYVEARGGEVITISPERIVDLPFGPALLTKTETKDGCHVCTGFIGVYYLAEKDGRTAITRRFPTAVSGWAWGDAPDYEITTRFTALPAIYSSGGDMHQGHAQSGALITELTPAGPVASDPIDTGSDDSGAIDEESGQQPCSVEGRIADIVRDRSFDVVMTGTHEARHRYVKRAGRFVALDKGDPACA